MIIQTVLISTFLLLIAVLLLGFRIFFVKDGKFPNIHIGGIKALRDKGINCATTQDREARKRNKSLKFNDLINNIKDNY